MSECQQELLESAANFPHVPTLDRNDTRLEEEKHGSKHVRVQTYKCRADICTYTNNKTY